MSEVICFFFQAEDGIRDYKVTGVQTCALPIYRSGNRDDLLGVRVCMPSQFGSAGDLLESTVRSLARVTPERRDPEPFHGGVFGPLDLFRRPDLGGLVSARCGERQRRDEPDEDERNDPRGTFHDASPYLFAGVSAILSRAAFRNPA